MNDGWCVECGDEFHSDDTGGYNPPCACKECDGFYCRSCCRRGWDVDDEYERPEESNAEET